MSTGLPADGWHRKTERLTVAIGSGAGWLLSSDEATIQPSTLPMRVEAFTAQPTVPAVLQGLSERMMGLEPTTFCMANASERARPFAPVRSNRLFAAVSVQASEPDRTRANAEPCHTCHRVRRAGTVPSTVRCL